MALDANQQIIHDNMYQVNLALQTLRQKYQAAIPALQSAGSTSDLALIQGLSNAVEPLQAAIAAAAGDAVDIGSA